MDKAPETFIGIFPEAVENQVPTASYKLRALRDLYESAPGFRAVSMFAMRLAGERSHNPVQLIGKPTLERVDNISFHNATVALASNSLADLVGFSPAERNILVTAAGLHDASKVIELELSAYRKLCQNADSSQLQQAKEVLQQLLVASRIPVKIDQILEDLQVMYDPSKFASYFDEQINPKFLRNVLSEARGGFTPDEAEIIANVASADSIGHTPDLIARVVYFAEKMGLRDDEAINKISDVATYVKQRGVLLAVSGNDQTDLMALALLYCDGISQNDRIVTIDNRMDGLINGGKYKDVDKMGENLYGMGFFEANRIVMHGAERVLMDLAVRNKFLPESTPSVDLPKHIFKNILRRADQRIR